MKIFETQPWEAVIWLHPDRSKTVDLQCHNKPEEHWIGDDEVPPNSENSKLITEFIATVATKGLQSLESNGKLFCFCSMESSLDVPYHLRDISLNLLQQHQNKVMGSQAGLLALTFDAEPGFNQHVIVIYRYFDTRAWLLSKSSLQHFQHDWNSK